MLACFSKNVLLGLTMFWAIGLEAVGNAQIMPLENWNSEVQLLVFVKQNCKPCQDLSAALRYTKVTFVGLESRLPYPKYLQDHSTKLLHRTFRVYKTTDYPSVFILQNRRVVDQKRGVINRKSVLGSYERAKSTDYPPLFKIQIGQQLTGEFANYTGLIAFWRGGCENCRLEQPQLERACQQKTLPILVLYTRLEGELAHCQARYGREYAMKWGSPGVPSFVFLISGIVRWLDVGYRDDLEQLIEALRVTGGRL